MSGPSIVTLAFVAGSLAATAAAAQQCPDGRPAFGSLGVGEFECVNGSCAINVRTGDPYSHSFSTEPRLRHIDPDGAGAGILREGDVLVAVDGRLITTAEGGRRLGSLEPGRPTVLTLRRDGREAHTTLTPEASCDLPRLTVTSGSRTMWAPVPDYSASYFRADTLRWDDTLPFLRADSMAFHFADPGDWAWSAPAIAADSSGLSFTMGARRGFYAAFGQGNGVWVGGRPPVEFGVELTCGDCGWRVRGAHRSFETDVFPVVASILKGGPADTAGLVVGDRLLAVNGHPITSSESGRLLGSLEPGDSVTLEVRRGDRVLEIALSPRAPGERRQRW